MPSFFFFFFFNDTATTEIYTLSLHDALPISCPISWVIFFFGRSSSSSFIAALRSRVLRLRSPLLLAQADALEPRQHLVAEEGKLVEVVDEGDGDPGQSRTAQLRERLCDMVRIAHELQAAHAVGIVAPLPVELIEALGLRRDVLHRQDAVDGREIGALDDGMLVILLGFLLRAPAGH